MKKLSLCAFLLLILSGCEEPSSAKSKYKCGETTFIVEKLSESKDSEFLLLNYEGDSQEKVHFGVFDKELDIIIILDVYMREYKPTLLYEVYQNNRLTTKHWRILEKQWDYVKDLVNIAKQKRLSDKGSDEHIEAERRLFDALWQFRDTYESKAEPQLLVERYCDF